MTALTAVAGALVGMAKVLDSYYKGRIKQLEENDAKKDAVIASKDQKISEMQSRLDAYGSISPDVVDKVQKLLEQVVTLPMPNSNPSSTESTGLPFPYEKSRPTRRRPRPTGDQ
jgi:hypothetical protein